MSCLPDVGAQDQQDSRADLVVKSSQLLPSCLERGEWPLDDDWGLHKLLGQAGSAENAKVGVRRVWTRLPKRLEDPDVSAGPVFYPNADRSIIIISVFGRNISIVFAGILANASTISSSITALGIIISLI